MATFRPVSRNIATSPQSSQDYLAMVEELAKLRRPTDVAMGFGTDRTPMAFALPQARGVAQVLPGTPVQTPVTPSAMVAPVYSTVPTEAMLPATDLIRNPKSKSGGGASHSEFKQIVDSTNNPSVENISNDGGIILSNGQTFYQDGTWRETPTSERTVAPKIYRQLSGGYAIYTDGKVRYTGEAVSVDPQTGEFVSGIQAIQDALFPRGGLRESGYYPGTNITQYFAENKNNPTLGYGALGHRGVDLASNENTPLSMPFNGTVVFAGWDKTGFGNSILVRLEDGQYIRMSHLNRIDVIPGQKVNKGYVIGLTGNTGRSTAAHLDVMTYDSNFNVINPAQFATNTQRYNFLTKGQRDKSVGDVVGDNELTTVQKMLLDEYRTTGEIKEVNKPQEELQRSLSETASAVGRLQPTKDQTLAGDIIAGAGALIGAPELGISELASGDVLGATTRGSEFISAQGEKRNLPEFGISEAVKKGGEIISDIDTAIMQGKQTAQNLLQKITNPVQQAEDIGTTLAQGIETKSALEQAKGLLSQVGNFQPGNLLGTAGRVIPGMIQKGYQQSVSVVPETEARPVGQTGFSGNVLMSGITTYGKQAGEKPAEVVAGEEQLKSTVQTPTVAAKTNQKQTFTAQPSGKSTSQQKPTQQISAKPVQQQKQLPKQAAPAPKTTTTLKQQVSKFTGTPFKPQVQQGKSQAPKPEAKPAPKAAPKPAPKKNVFAKVVSKVKQVFKKK